LLALVALLACSSPPPQEPPPAPVETPKQAFDANMRLHLELATATRSAVIIGDLGAVKAAAKEIVDANPPELPKAWEPGFTVVKGIAGKIAEAKDVDEAAQGVAALSAACGACHGATGGGPRKDVADALAQKQPPEGIHMREHLWAADRMWLGMVGHSTELFDSAAATLASSDLHQKAHEGATGVPPEFAVFEKQVHELAEAATKGEGPEERIRLYGHFLANCAHCHQMMGVPPRL
jgi:mono/diheme cytochrome c family protein